MDDLIAWLRDQNGGVGTYVGLQQRAQRAAGSQPGEDALLGLLSALAYRFVALYDGMPLSVDVAQATYEHVLLLVEKAAAVRFGSAEQKLAVLDEIARADLT